MNQPRVFRVFDLTGIVEGVGLRATVRWLATRDRLCGWVQNRSDRVRLRLEGDADAVSLFMQKLPQGLPPDARLDTVREIASGVLAEGEGFLNFSIRHSEA